jgi:hypothetical protein
VKALVAQKQMRGFVHHPRRSSPADSSPPTSEVPPGPGPLPAPGERSGGRRPELRPRPVGAATRSPPPGRDHPPAARGVDPQRA